MLPLEGLLDHGPARPPCSFDSAGIEQFDIVQNPSQVLRGIEVASELAHYLTIELDVLRNHEALRSHRFEQGGVGPTHGMAVDIGEGVLTQREDALALVDRPDVSNPILTVE